MNLFSQYRQKDNSYLIATFFFILLLSVVMFVPNLAHADDKKGNALSNLFSKSTSKFLKVDEAFQTNITQTGKKVVVDFTVTPKHYVYKDRIKLQLANSDTLIQAVSFSKKTDSVVDPDFGKVDVFPKNFQVVFELPKSVKIGDKLTFKWQGCAKAGLCYPPVKKDITIKKKIK